MGKLNEIYEKDIAREIQGVIKVDDENYIKQELEEYVVTDELLKHFNSFFESYNAGINGNTEKMGVWISGFFGSGKSHFLKIVSYLLENKIVDGKAAVDYFDGKIQDAKYGFCSGGCFCLPQQGSISGGGAGGEARGGLLQKPHPRGHSREALRHSPGGV